MRTTLNRKEKMFRKQSKHPVYDCFNDGHFVVDSSIWLRGKEQISCHCRKVEKINKFKFHPKTLAAGIFLGELHRSRRDRLFLKLSLSCREGRVFLTWLSMADILTLLHLFWYFGWGSFPSFSLFFYLLPFRRFKMVTCWRAAVDWNDRRPCPLPA